MTQITYADFLRDTGMALALEAKPDWSARADKWFDNLPVGTQFTSEDLIEAIGLPDLVGTNANNAVGAKMRFFKTRAKEVGFRKTIRITSHSRRIIVWRKEVQGD